ncbi:MULTISPECIES: DUF3192 domain-containing protein [unclassified Pseudoalteromonas]|uniref:DUF3192 domain-containing protein n=1 Tax=unclassified Pseudoalteromonas TaxID=194690 RepID=UPI002096F1E3|nr:DUF3192 domain-containing protein [Pseudoalteromonas sp. XMcav2-N]MCO7191292.1 DUF3192 domain-containing protein [Pseudoalteromonas sp. XMcav2-N]
MKKLLIATALLSSTALTGCVVAVTDGEYNGHHGWKKEQKQNREKISQLKMGTEYQHVLNKLGTPEFTDMVSKDDTVYQVLYFATNSKHSDGVVTKDECTPLLFKNNKLVGFGDTALAHLL